MGRHLSRAHADFDPRDFGHQRLGSLVSEQPYLETTGQGSGLQVRLKQKRSSRGSAAKKATSGGAGTTKQATTTDTTKQAPTKQAPTKEATAKRAAAKKSAARKA